MASVHLLSLCLSQMKLVLCRISFLIFGSGPIKTKAIGNINSLRVNHNFGNIEIVFRFFTSRLILAIWQFFVLLVSLADR